MAATSRLSDQIRAAIDASGSSRQAICRAIGLDPAVMSRFMADRSGLSFETLDKLGEHLGLEIRAQKARRRTKQGRGGER